MKCPKCKHIVTIRKKKLMCPFCGVVVEVEEITREELEQHVLDLQQELRKERIKSFNLEKTIRQIEIVLGNRKVDVIC